MANVCCCWCNRFNPLGAFKLTIKFRSFIVKLSIVAHTLMVLNFMKSVSQVDGTRRAWLHVLVHVSLSVIQGTNSDSFRVRTNISRVLRCEEYMPIRYLFFFFSCRLQGRSYLRNLKSLRKRLLDQMMINVMVKSTFVSCQNARI